MELGRDAVIPRPPPQHRAALLRARFLELSVALRNDTAAYSPRDTDDPFLPGPEEGPSGRAPGRGSAVPFCCRFYGCKHGAGGAGGRMLLPLQVIRNYLTLCPFCLKWEDLSNTRIREGLQATLGVKLRSQGSWLPGRGQGTGVGAGEPPGGVLLSNPQCFRWYPVFILRHATGHFSILKTHLSPFFHLYC